MPRPDPPEVSSGSNLSSIDEGGTGGERQRKTPKGLRHIEKASKRFVLDPVVSVMKLMTDSNGEENEKEVLPRANSDDAQETSDRKSVGVIDKFDKSVLKKEKSVMDVLAAIPSTIMPFAFSKEEVLEESPVDSSVNSNGATLKSTNIVSHDCIPGDITSLLDSIIHIPTATSLATTSDSTVVLTVAVGDSILPLCSNIEKRQQLSHVGLHSGVEYVVCAIKERKDINGKDDLLISMKLSYPLGPQFQSKGPVTILASDVPVFTSRTKTMTQGVLKHAQSTVTFDINKGVNEEITVDEKTLLQQITLPSVTVVVPEYNDMCFMGIGSILTIMAIHIWSYTESIRANQFPLSVVSIFTGVAFLLGYAIGRRSILEDNHNDEDGGKKARLKLVKRLNGPRRAQTTSLTRRRKRDTIFGAFRRATSVESINSTRSGSELREWEKKLRGGRELKEWEKKLREPFTDRLLMDHLLKNSRPPNKGGSRRRTRTEESIEGSASDDVSLTTDEGIEIGKIELNNKRATALEEDENYPHIVRPMCQLRGLDLFMSDDPQKEIWRQPLLKE